MGTIAQLSTNRVRRTSYRPLSQTPDLTLASSADYSGLVELPHLKDDLHFKLVRPLVEAYLAFWRTGNRNIKLMKLTPPQFDVLVILGDTHGMTCSELSEQTLVTKDTLTGVLDRLVSNGLVRRETIRGDRCSTRILLTAKEEASFRKTFAAHIAFLGSFFCASLEPARSGSDLSVTMTSPR